MLAEARRRSARQRGRRRRAAARRPGTRADADRIGDRDGSSSTSVFAPDLDGVHPLGRGAHRDAGHAVPVRLLLEPARVRRDHPCLRGGGGEREIAHRLAQLDVRAERDPSARSIDAVRGWAGNTTGSSRRESPSAIRRSRSGRTFASRCTVATTYVPGAWGGGTRAAGDRREAERRVGHHVADDLDPPGGSLGAQRLRRALVRAEEEARARRPRSARAPRASTDPRSADPASTCAMRSPPPPRRGRRRASSSCPRGRRRGPAVSAASTARIAGVRRSTSAVRRSSR